MNLKQIAMKISDISVGPRCGLPIILNDVKMPESLIKQMQEKNEA